MPQPTRTVGHPKLNREVTVPQSTAQTLVRIAGWKFADAPGASPYAGLNVDEVLDQVGDDPAKAADALAVESSATRPRSTLISALEDITHPQTAGDGN